MGDGWGETGGHGCENVATGDLEINERLCLLCQTVPVDECNETGTPVIVRAPPAQRVDGGPVRCCDMWDTRCPACDRGSEKSCFTRCKYSCEGCVVGMVWYAPGSTDLFPEDQWCNMSDEEHGWQGDVGGQGEQEEEARAEREMQEDMIHGMVEGGGPVEEEGGGRATWVSTDGTDNKGSCSGGAGGADGGGEEEERSGEGSCQQEQD